MSDDQKHATPTLPQLGPGDRFRFTSRRGSDYSCTFVYQGPAAHGMVVRFASGGRLARLDPAHVAWSTLRLDESSGQILVPGDKLVVQTASSRISGRLLEAEGEGELSVLLTDGQRRVIPHGHVNSLLLLFPASELLAGDEFRIRSLSGRDYQGRVASEDSGRLEVDLDEGRRVHLRAERLDMSTLYLRLPIAPSALG